MPARAPVPYPRTPPQGRTTGVSRAEHSVMSALAAVSRVLEERMLRPTQVLGRTGQAANYGSTLSAASAHDKFAGMHQ
ncbi:hypothetical protein WOLCODRAFT_166060 [Wolfiporia cocos MD-104 SS10]|uniref:Uncharacterized protein n=1 Tax=Wolfiporia cocos (strain MD-104) TaxID=742152 RepID=A0A2H3JGJ1_WOLCO|nr:hypothetical protein WOLCODRAFT_166060 [Wolfiporia cocos MD-104 SS10]